MSPLLTFYLQNGQTLSAPDSLSRSFERQMDRLGTRGVSFMRVGRFSVTLLADDTLAIARQYTGICDDGSITPGSRFWRSHVDDRTAQLDKVERHLAGHPLERDVREDIRAERANLARTS